MNRIAKEEFKLAKKAGLSRVLNELAKKETASKTEEIVAAPPKEVVTAQIPGIEVMDLEDAVAALWKEKIYAESGMGCTGPIIRISEVNKEKSEKILSHKGFI